MPEIIPGFDTQQKTVTVTATDVAINAEIATQSADVTGGWIVMQLILNGTDMTIWFQRNVAIALP